MIERVAVRLNNWFGALAALLLIFVLAMLGQDWFQPWIGPTVPAKTVKGIGKALGEIAAGLLVLAFSYYLLREFFIRTRRFVFNLPLRLEAAFKYSIRLLRLLHPLIGFLLFLTVLLHGYILWNLQNGAKTGGEIWSGVAAGLVLLGVVISGFLVRQMPKVQLWRLWHRWVGVVLMAAYALHKYWS